MSLILALAGNAYAQVTIDINPKQLGKKVSPMLYGIFFEDINHAADGGLYAELIRNRSFEDDTLEPWKTGICGNQTGELTSEITTKDLLNNAQKKAMSLRFENQEDGYAYLENAGYWGIHAVQGRTYQLSFWAKGTANGTIKAMLVGGNAIENGAEVYAETLVNGTLDSQWKKFSATLSCSANDPKARFVLVFTGKGEVDVDVVSLFPPTYKDRPNGCRPDLASMLAELKPRFVRFPGGCVVEGNLSSDNAFHWERTVGPIEERPGHMNANWWYPATDGMGFHEFLQLSEDIGAKPLYVVNLGIWHGGVTPLDELQDTWIRECLEAMEYANGPVTSKFGAIRARNGHPKPFNLEYIELGNENNQPNQTEQADHYYERYDMFRKAILEKYPKTKIVGNVAAWGTDDPRWDSDLPVDLLDEHYYRSPAWFADNFHKYDSYERTTSNGKPAPKIYCGEYAVTQGFGKNGNLNAALGEAVFMMGMENNSDIVAMASYAPIFVNENDQRWRPDMIRFNSAHSMGTPSYYVQQLMANNVGTRIVPVTQSDPYGRKAESGLAKPQRNRMGFATWGTKSSYELVSFFNPSNGSDADLSSMEHGADEAIGKGWTRNGNVVSQQGFDEGTLYVCSPSFESDHYKLKVRARKEEGREGFMVVFNYVDPDNYCWFNLGGWGNTQHGIEQVINGSKSALVTKAGHIEAGRWYDITVEELGDTVTCLLDNEEIFRTVLRHDTSSGIYSSATYDENSREYIVKVVNTTGGDTTAEVNLKGTSIKNAAVTRLSSLKGTDENTIDTPTNIIPVSHDLHPSKGHLTVDVPAYSLNIIRFK